MTRRLVPWLALASALVLVALLPSTARAETPVSGTLSADTTWSFALSPYLVTGDVTVAGYDGADGVTKLTVEPGVVVRFMPGTRLAIGDGLETPGALAANGSILFTSAAASPAPGDWQGIVFSPTTDDELTFVQGATVEYAGQGATGLLHAVDSAPTLRANLMRHSAGHGVYGAGRWAAPRVADNTFVSNALAPVRTSPWGAGAVDANDLAANGADRTILVYGERLEAATTWDDAGAPFRVAGAIVVAGDYGPDGVTTLTLGRGVTVQMGSGARFEVGECCEYTGALATEGTVASPVVFTSDQPEGSKTPGHWDRLHFYGASYDAGSVLRNTTFEFGGAGGRGMVHANASAPAIHGGVLRQSAAYGVYAEGAGAFPTIEGAAFEANTPAHARILPDGVRLLTGNSFSAGEVEVLSGSLFNDGSWTAQGAAYRMTGSLTLAGASGPDLRTGLELGPGVEVRFPAGAALLALSGSVHVNASGTPGAPVLLTSTNATKEPGQWRGLHLQSGSDRGHLEHLVVESAGGGANGALVLYWSAPTPLHNVTIRGSGAHGIYLDCPVSPTLTDVHVLGSVRYGLFEDGGSGCAATLTRVTIEASGERAAKLHMDTPRAGLVLVENAIEEIELYRTTTAISTSTTLELRTDRDTGARYAYNMISSMTVQNDAVLTIEPGVTTRWQPWAALNVGLCCSNGAAYRGTLVARGTVEFPVVFDTADDTSRWSGVFLEGYGLSPDPDHALANATFARSRDDGLHLRRITAGTYDNVTVERNWRGLYLDDASTTTWRGLVARDNADVGVYVGSNSLPLFLDMVAERNGNYGLYVASTSARATVLGGAFREHGGRPARVRFDDTFAPTELRANGIREIALLSIDLYADVTLARPVDADDGGSYAYAPTGSVTVRNSATLTLEPGVSVLWPNLATLNVGICCSNGAAYLGRIVARGTEALPITLDAADSANRWYGLYLEGYGLVPDADHDLANVTIARSRDDGLHLRRITAGTYDDLTLRDNARFGLYLQDTTSATLRNAKILDNLDIGAYQDGSSTMTLLAARLSGNARWAIYGQAAGDVFVLDAPVIENTLGKPWRIRVDDVVTAPVLRNNADPELEFWGTDVLRNVTFPRRLDETTGATYTYAMVSYSDVRNGRTLTVDPGVTVRFDNAAGFRFGGCCTAGSAHQGALLAEGTTEQPIWFVNRTPVSTSAWHGLEVDGSVTPAARLASVLRNVTIEGSRANGLHVLRTSLGTWDNVTSDNHLNSGFVFNTGVFANATNLVARGNGALGGIRLITDAKVGIVGALVQGGADHGVYLQNDNTYLTLVDGVVRGSPQYGLYAGGTWGGGAALANVTIEDVGGRPWRLNAWSVTEDVTLRNNAVADLEWTRSDVGENRTWARHVDAAHGLPYAYTARDGIRFYNNGTLTIEPGVDVQFLQNAWMDIGWCCHTPSTKNRAGLVAEGTADLPIRLLAQSGTRATGWFGLYLQGDGVTGDFPATLRNVTISGSKDDAIQVNHHDASVLDNVTLRDTTRYGLYASNSGVATVRGLVVEDTANHGLYTDGTAAVDLVGGAIRRAGGHGVYHANANAPGRYVGLAIQDGAGLAMRVRLDTDLAGLALAGNAIRRLELHAQDVAVDRTLPLLVDPDGSPYATVVLSTFTIHTGAKLTVLPGAIVLMPQDQRILVGRCCFHTSLDPGALLAVGTEAAPITFGSTTGAKATGWRGLYFDGRSNYGELPSILRNVTALESRGDLVEVYGHQSVTLDRLRLVNATASALWSRGTSRVNLTDSVLEGGQHGLYLQDTPTVLQGNKLSGFTTHGIYLERAHASLVEGNDVAMSGGTGLRLVDTDNSFFRGNRLTDAATGVRVEASSTGNTLTNNLLRNTVNANDSPTSTLWHAAAAPGLNVCGGPTLAGNCWSDYAGVDTNDDGVGDTLLPYKTGIAGPGDLAPVVVRPFAEFTSEIVDPTEGIVAFTDLSTDPVHPIVNWTWDFDDGTFGYEQHPVHDYTFEGFFLVTLTITDAGGATASATHSVLLDSIPPLTTGLLSGIQGQAGWWISNVSVTLDADDNESAVASVLYRVGGTGNFSEYGAPIPLSADGVNTVEYYAVDLGGNAEPVRRLDVSIDQTTTTTTATLDGTLHPVGWYTTNVTATLSALDATSGVDLTYYTLDGGEPTVYVAPVAIRGTGVHALDPFSEDVAGNLEAAVTQLVRVDLTPPTSTVVVTNGTPGENGWWRSAVDVGLAGADAGAGVAALQMGIDGAPLTPYTGPVALAGEGIHTVGHQATDLVDRLEALRSTLVKIDATPPELGVALAGDLHPSGWYRTPVLAYVNATDLTAGLNRTEYRLNNPGFVLYNGPVSIATTNTHTLQARATDLAGNLITGLTLNPKVDVTAPTTTHSVVSGVHGTSHWYRSDVVSRLTAADGLGSGVVGTSFALDGAPMLPYVGDVLITGEALHRLNATSTDVVGHVEALKTFLVGIDLTAPTSVANVTGQQNPANGAYYGPITVRLLASDALSGVQRIEYWINGAGPTNFNANNPIRINQAGVYNLTFRALDLALNAQPLQTLPLVLDFDITPPTTVATLTGVAGKAPWYRSPVTVGLSSVDTGAGVGLIEYQLGNGEWTSYLGAFEVSEQTLHTLRFRATDLVGNIEATKLLTFGVDTSPPVTTVNVVGPPGDNGWYAGPVDVTLGAVDAVSAIDSLRYRVNGAAWQTVGGVVRMDQSGVFLMEWAAVDLGGNPAGGNLTLKIDFDLPQAAANVTGIAGNESWFRSGVLVTLDATDPTSGILGIEYSLDGGAWVPYVGPINITAEGNHTLYYAPLDIVGNRGLELTLQLNIDLTTPIVSLNIDQELYLLIDETIVVRERLCIHISGLDLLSGLNTLVIHVVGIVNKVIELDIGVNYHCVELPDGVYDIQLVGCDRAGWCGAFGFRFTVDNGPPLLWLVRPTPGSIMVQNVSAPIFRTLFGHDRTAVYADVSGVPPPPAEPPEAPVTWSGWPEAAPLRDPRDGDHLNATVMSRNDTLARTTIVTGPRVPIWISAWDATGVTRVEFLLDGIPIATATRPERHELTTFGIEQRNVLDRNGAFDVHLHQVDLEVYVVTIDTLGMIAGAHNVTVQAMDLLGSQSEATFSFIFQSGQNFENAAEDLAQLTEQLELPPEATPWRDWIAANLRFFGPLIDASARRNYLFLDEGLFEFEGVWDPVVAAPGLAYADEGWSI